MIYSIIAMYNKVKKLFYCPTNSNTTESIFTLCGKSTYGPKLTLFGFANTYPNEFDNFFGKIIAVNKKRFASIKLFYHGGICEETGGGAFPGH